MNQIRVLRFVVVAWVLAVALIGAQSSSTSYGWPGLRTGVALTPAHFEPAKGHAPSNEDIQQMFKLGTEVGTTAVFIYQWGQADLVTVAQKMIELSRQSGLTPIIGLSPTVLSEKRDRLDVPETVQRQARGRPSFSQKPVSDAFGRDALALARLKPPYLCLATEINMLALANLKEYLFFARTVKDLYPAIKKASPETKVFVSFQWDVLRMMDMKEPTKVKEWSKQIDIFRPELDVVAFTSYPMVVYDRPDRIPDDYYDRILDHVQKEDEVIFMEIGWPSGGKSTEQHQVDFIKRLPGLLAKVTPSIIGWPLLHDVRLPAFGAHLGTTGLVDGSGKRKPAFEVFRSLVKR